MSGRGAGKNVSPAAQDWQAGSVGTRVQFVNLLLGGNRRTAWVLAGLSLSAVCGPVRSGAAVLTDGQEGSHLVADRERIARGAYQESNGLLAIKNGRGNGAGLLEAAPGGLHVIQATTDFQEWINVQTNSTDAFGVLDFIDVDSPLFPHRFYRGEEQ